MKVFNCFKCIILCIFTIASFVSFNSCQKDDLTPEGTISINLRNQNNGGGSIQMGNTYIELSSSNNLGVYNIYGYDAKICDVGTVKGLGRVNKIPNSGWSNNVAAIPGHGYVIRISSQGDENIVEYSYGRLYLKSWNTTSGDLIIGAMIEYQYPYIP